MLKFQLDYAYFLRGNVSVKLAEEDEEQDKYLTDLIIPTLMA